jgi:hypothetical protein
MSWACDPAAIVNGGHRLIIHIVRPRELPHLPLTALAWQGKAHAKVTGSVGHDHIELDHVTRQYAGG